MEKHLAIFKGYKRRVVYEFDRYKYKDLWCVSTTLPEFYKSEKNTSYEKFLEKEVDYPPIEVGEKVYIKEIDSIVEVTGRVRNLDGGYIYDTEYTIDLIEDEITKESYAKAKQMEQDYEEQTQRKEEEIKKSLLEMKTTPLKKWYQFWK